MARRIVITSGKGGVGKTTCAASIGSKLAKKGHKTLLIDGDIGLNNLDVLTGIDGKVNYDMLGVLEGKYRIKQALMQSRDNPDLYIMSSHTAMASEDVGAKSFRTLITRLSEGFDYLLIDCPAGIERGFHRAISAANEAIVVVTPHTSAIKDAARVMKILETYNLNGTSLIVNKVRGDLLLKGDIIEPREIAKILKADLIGVIKEDDRIGLISEIGRLGESYGGDEVFSVIAENIISGRRRILDTTAEYRGMIGRLRLMLKRSVS